MDDVLDQAERRVRNAEERVARQAALITELENDSRFEAATTEARDVLETLERTLELMRRHLRLERQERGLKV